MADKIEPISHTEKVIAGQEQPISHLEKVIAQYGGGSGATGSMALTKDIKANIEVGGTGKYYLFRKGMTFDEYVEAVHIKYLRPSVTISIFPNETVYEKGASITDLAIRSKTIKEDNPIKSTTFYINNTAVFTKDTTSSGMYVTYTHKTAINTDAEIKVVLDDGITNDTTSNIIKISFVDPMYVGLSSGTLNKLVILKGNYTYSNITCVNDNVVFKYPASYGDLNSILDTNGFENLNSFTKTTEIINSINYNVYTSGKATLNGFSYTFKF